MSITKYANSKFLIAAKGDQTGDGTRVGFFIPLPKELADQFPSLGSEDSSPTHVTFFIVGVIPQGIQEEFISAVQVLANDWVGPVPATLGGLDYFVHPGKDRRVAHLSVKFGAKMAEWRSQLFTLCQDFGLDVSDFSPAVYSPHVTLQYIDGFSDIYDGNIPQGSWLFDEIEIWGLPKLHKIKFGTSVNDMFIVRNAYLNDMVRSVVAKYKKKVEMDDGNIIYQYGPRQVANRNKKKAERLEILRKSIADIKKKVNADLNSDDPKTRDTALAVGLMNDTYERVGNPNSAKEGRYGVTGWTVEHISFKGKTAEISYVGKSHVQQKKTVSDPKLITALKKICKNKSGSDSIFSCEDYTVTASDVNSYLSEFKVTAKDIRGYHANREMQNQLLKIRKDGPALPTSRKEKDKILKDEFKKALDEVADRVGHQASTLRSQYLVPGLEDSYLHNGSVSKEMVKIAGSLLPVLDPRFNFREIYKQIVLLEDHISHPKKRCPDCIIKHFMTIEAFAEEAVTIDDGARYTKIAEAIAGYARWSLSHLLEVNPFKMCQFWRKVRKNLIPLFRTLKVATKSTTEKEDEDVEGLVRKSPKKKPPRDDLRRQRLKTEDPDLDHGDNGDDKDLSLNYKRVARLYRYTSVPLIRLAVDFETENEWEIYKEQHPDTDIRKHKFLWKGKDKNTPSEEDEGGGKKKKKKDDGEENGKPGSGQKEIDPKELDSVLDNLLAEADLNGRVKDRVREIVSELPDADSNRVAAQYIGRVKSSLAQIGKSKNKSVKELTADDIKEAFVRADMEFSREHRITPSYTKKDNIDKVKKPKRVRSEAQKQVAQEAGDAEEAFGEVMGESDGVVADDLQTQLSDWLDKLGNGDEAQAGRLWEQTMESYDDELDDLSRKMENSNLNLPTHFSTFEGEMTPESVGKFLAQSRFVQKKDDIHQAMQDQMARTNEKRVRALGSKIRNILSPEGKSRYSFADDVKDLLERKIASFSLEDLDSLKSSVEDTIKDHMAGFSNPNAKSLSDAVKRVSGGLSDTDAGNPRVLGEELGNLIFADQVVLDPSRHIPEGVDPGEASFELYRGVKDADRKLIAEKIESKLKTLAPDSPDRERLDHQLDGLVLSQVINGEEVSGRPQPSKSLSALARSLDKKGEATRLLGSMENFVSRESRDSLRSLVSDPDSMSKEDLFDFIGGEDSPYTPVIDMINAKNDMGNPKYTEKQRKDLERFLRSMAVFDMTIGHATIDAALRQKKGKPPSRDEVEKAKHVLTDQMVGDALKAFPKAEPEQVVQQYGSWEEGSLPEGDDDDLMFSAMNTSIQYTKDMLGDDFDLRDVPGLALQEKSLEKRDEKVLDSNVEPELMKSASESSQELQFYIYSPVHIDEGNGALLCQHEDEFHQRRIPMSLSKKGAAQVTHTIDRIASVVQEEFEKLGLTQKMAFDFAYHCDVISNHIEKEAGLDKEALTGFDPVKEPGFNPEEIGQEQSGPQEGDSDEAYMRSQFSQQENRELRDKQESGAIENTKGGTPIIDERPPSAGKQAGEGDALDQSISNLQKEAFTDLLSELGKLSTDFQLVQARLRNASPDLSGKLNSNLGTHLKAIDKAQKVLIAAEGSGETLEYPKLDAVEKIIKASREVSSHLGGVVEYLKKGHDEGSPSAQLKFEELLEDNTGRIAKLCQLSSNIVNRASDSLGVAKKEAADKEAGCEKLPPALRENCEKKQNEGKGKDEEEEKEKENKKASPQGWSHGFDL